MVSFLQVFGRKFWLRFPTFPPGGGADTEIQGVTFCGNFIHSDDSSVTVVTKATGLDSWRIEVRFPERNTFPFSQAFLGSTAARRVALTTHPHLALQINSTAIKFYGNFVHSDDSAVTIVTKVTGLDSWRIEARFPVRNTFPFSQAFLWSTAARRVMLTTHPHLASKINSTAITLLPLWAFVTSSRANFTFTSNFTQVFSPTLRPTPILVGTELFPRGGQGV